jgi:hypothetical protein
MAMILLEEEVAGMTGACQEGEGKVVHPEASYPPEAGIHQAWEIPVEAGCEEPVNSTGD